MKNNTGHEFNKQELAEVIKTKVQAQSYANDGVPIHDWDNAGEPITVMIPASKPHKSRLSRLSIKGKAQASPQACQLTELDYRRIAVMFAKALPIEGEDFRQEVESNLASIKALPIEAKNALKAAYIFGSKVPREEREDLFQDLALACLKAKTPDMKLAYAIARCDWLNWWSKYKIRQHTSLDSVIEDSEGNPVTLGELLVGEVEFEAKMDGKLDAERLWQKLPTTIKPIVGKRLAGKALNNTERSWLHRWLKADGYKLLLA